MVAKLIVTYISGKGNKPDVLRLMARMLNFTDDELQKVGLLASSTRGWIPFLGRSSSSVPPSPSNSNNNNARSVGDLWMEFLLKEVGEMKPEVSEDNEDM